MEKGEGIIPVQRLRSGPGLSGPFSGGGEPGGAKDPGRRS